MKKYLRAFKTQAEYLAFTASTEFILDNVSSCREGDLVYYNSEQCGGQGIHRTISGETYCNGYDKYVYLYKQVSYDDGATWETTATTSSLVEKNSEDCGYVPPTPPSDWDITAKFNVTSTSSPTPIGYNQYTSGFSKIEIDGVVQPSVTSAYTFSTTGEHTVKYTLTDPTSIGNFAFKGCSGLTSIDIPSGVTSINYQAFSGCRSLTSIDIPSGVTSIESAFEDCISLTSIVIPDSVTRIGENVFLGCSGLTSCTIGSGVTSIGTYAFRGCSGLTSIDIPNSVTYIGSSAFTSCVGLTSITVEATTPPTLSSGAFIDTNNCPIYVSCDSVDAYKAASIWSSYASRIQAIPRSCNPIVTAKFNVTDTSSPTEIASDIRGFKSIEIDGVEQPNVVSAYTFSTIGEHTINYMLTTTTLDGYAFLENTNITSIDIPSGVKSIGMYCLMKCSGITSVDIPDSVTYIAEGAFQYNPSLTSVTIGNGITTILWSAFRGCSGLTSITVNAVTPPTLGGDALSMTNDCPIYVPCDSVDAYKAASGWSDYASRIQAIPGSC